MQPTSLVGAADALSMYVSTRDTIRAGRPPHTEAGSADGWTGDDEVVLMELARSNAEWIIAASLSLSADRVSDLEARLRIVNDGVRTLGLDHPVVAQAAGALARDTARFAQMSAA